MTRTFVTFRTDRFNTTEVGAHFINPGCFGEDCAAWLVDELRATRVGRVDEPWQEDWGWQAGVGTSDAKFLLSVGLMEEDAETDGARREWLVMLAESRSFVARLTGRRESPALATLVRAIHAALTAAPDVSDVRWHERGEFERGRSMGSPDPFAGGFDP